MADEDADSEELTVSIRAQEFRAATEEFSDAVEALAEAAEGLESAAVYFEDPLAGGTTRVPATDLIDIDVTIDVEVAEVAPTDD